MATGNLGVSSHVEDLLKQYCSSFEEAYQTDAVYLHTPLVENVNRLVRRDIEKLEPRKETLAVVLHTLGGEMGAAERLCLIFRHFYDKVHFFVPDYAYSAGTALAMSGDEIYMDFDAVLGPTDTQVLQGGEFVSATGYLEKYREIVESSYSEKGIAPAELELLIVKYDHARMFDLEQSLLRTRNVVADWLVKYKFKDWEKHGNTGKPVTEKEKHKRAKQIAKWLNDAKRWSSHGRGISIDVLRDDLRLQVCPIAEEGDGKKESLRAYHRLIVDYCGKIGAEVAVHTRNGLSAPGINREDTG